MKKIFRILQFLLLFQCMAGRLMAQAELAQRLGTSTDFGYIKKTVTDYYKQKMTSAISEKETKVLNHEQKMWARWLWYHEGRLDDKNHLTNIAARNFEAVNNTPPMPNSPDIFYGGWSNIGPNEVVSINNTNANTGIGRTTCIAFHPTDVNTFYVGTLAGGVWKTTNGGTIYSPMSDEIASLGIASIVVDVSNPNNIYVMTGDGDSHNSGGWFIPSFGYIRWSVGVLKSTNGGITWNATGLSFNTSQQVSGYKIIQDPSNPSMLLAATSDGIYRTIDGGASFIKVSTLNVSDLRFKEGNSSIVYAAPKTANARLYKSTNNGQAFNLVNNNLPNGISRMAFATTPADATKLYALCGASIDSAHFVGLYRSSDDGTNFTLQCNSPNVLSNNTDSSGNFFDEVPAHLTLAMNPATSFRLITGCVRIWTSANFGVNFSVGANPHADVHQIAYNPLDGNAYAATDGGIYKSSDNGATWTFWSHNLNCATYYHLTGTEQDANRLLGGLQDDGVALRTGFSNTFYNVAGGDGFDGIINRQRMATHYLSSNQSIFRSIDGGSTNTNITPSFFTGNNAEWYPNLVMHPSDTNIIYAGYSSFSRSTNRGTNWTYGPYSSNWAIGVSSVTPDRVYTTGGDWAAGTLNGRVDRSDNTGTNWTTNLQLNPGFPSSFGKITDIAVNPFNSDDVWVTFGGYLATAKVAHSINAGASWTTPYGTLPNVPINCIAIDNSGNVYLGTDIGVYVRTSTDPDWKPFYNGLPRIPVTDLVINNTSGKIRAGTFGRGVYESALYSACPATLTLNGLYSGQQSFSASVSVTSTGTINHSAGTEVFIKSGGYIDFLPGFEAEQNSFMKARIAPCGSGIDSTGNMPAPLNNYLLPASSDTAVSNYKAKTESMDSLSSPKDQGIKNPEIKIEVINMLPKENANKLLIKNTAVRQERTDKAVF